MVPFAARRFLFHIVSKSTSAQAFPEAVRILGAQASNRSETDIVSALTIPPDYTDLEAVAGVTSEPEIGDEDFGASFMPSLPVRKKYRRRSLVHGNDSHAGTSIGSDRFVASAADTMRSIERMNTNASEVDSSTSTVVEQSPPRRRASREGSQDAAMHSVIRGLACEAVSQDNHSARINDHTMLSSHTRPSSAAQHAARSARPRLPQARKPPPHVRSLADRSYPQTRSPELGSGRPSTFSIPSSTPGPRDSIDSPPGRINTSAMPRPPGFGNPVGALNPPRILIEFLSSDNDLLRRTSWADCSRPEAFFAHALAAFSGLTSENIKFAVFKVVMNGEENGAFRVMNGVKGDFDHLVARVRMFWDQLLVDEEGFTIVVSRA